MTQGFMNSAPATNAFQGKGQSNKGKPAQQNDPLKGICVNDCLHASQAGIEDRYNAHDQQGLV